MARRTKEDAEKTREEILQASLDIFCEKGYSKTTFDDIAKRIELTKGAIYWHFKNKPDLLAALICHCEKNKQAIINKNIPHIKTLNDLRDYFIICTNMIKEDIYYRKFLFFVMYQMEWSETIFNCIRETIENIREFPLQRLKETLTIIQKSGEIAPEINIDETSNVILALWQGLLSNEIGQIKRTDFSKTVAIGFDLLIKGLKEERS